MRLAFILRNLSSKHLTNFSCLNSKNEIIQNSTYVFLNVAAHYGSKSTNNETKGSTNMIKHIYLYITRNKIENQADYNVFQSYCPQRMAMNK